MGNAGQLIWCSYASVAAQCDGSSWETTDTRWNRCPATWRRRARCADASSPDSLHRIVWPSATVAISAIPQQCPTPSAKRLCRPPWWVCDLRTRSARRPTCPNRPWTRGIRHAVRCTDICPEQEHRCVIKQQQLGRCGGNGSGDSYLYRRKYPSASPEASMSCVDERQQVAMMVLALL